MKRIVFPTALRKMWSGAEVQEWLDANLNQQALEPDGQSLVLLHKSYDGESIYDATRDFDEAFDESLTEQVKAIPVDEHGFQQGKFTVNVAWSPEQ